GEAATALKLVQDRRIPVFVVGVGTTVGGVIPEPETDLTAVTREPRGRLRSSLDRASLQAIAATGRGEYFELDRDGDREIANRIIDAGRRRAGTRDVQETSEELYWRFLAGSAVFIMMGSLFLRQPAELAFQFAGAVAVLVFVASLLK